MGIQGIKKSNKLFYIGIASLIISVLLRVVQIVDEYLRFFDMIYIFDMNYNYIISYIILPTIAVAVMGSLIELKKVSYKVFSVALVLLILSISNPDSIYVIISMIFYILLILSLFINVNKIIIIIAAVLFAVYAGMVDIAYYAYYILYRVFGGGELTMDTFISCIVCIAASVTYYFGLAVVFMRVMYHKNISQKKTVSGFVTPQERLIELKRQYETGHISEIEYNIQRQDIIDKL